ncbi:MAG: hypothetical protein H7Z19_18285 [Chitinophagaceae bacterium]|nr:hypothetical protein [Rubrivivax sp.]
MQESANAPSTAASSSQRGRETGALTNPSAAGQGAALPPAEPALFDTAGLKSLMPDKDGASADEWRARQQRRVAVDEMDRISTGQVPTREREGPATVTPIGDMPYVGPLIMFVRDNRSWVVAGTVAFMLLVWGTSLVSSRRVSRAQPGTERRVIRDDEAMRKRPPALRRRRRRA